MVSDPVVSAHPAPGCCYPARADRRRCSLAVGRQVLACGLLLLLRGSLPARTVSVYSRFTEEEKEKYFGLSKGSQPSLRDFTVSRGAHPKGFVNPVVCSPCASQPPYPAFRRSLNANLAQNPTLFNVTSITLPASNVTHFTRNGDIAPD